MIPRWPCGDSTVYNIITLLFMLLLIGVAIYFGIKMYKLFREPHVSKADLASPQAELNRQELNENQKH